MPSTKPPVKTIRDRKPHVDLAAKRAIADRKAAHIAPFVHQLQLSGVVSATGIARGLDSMNVRPPSGRGVWTASQVGRLLRRIAATKQDDSAS
jgi:hypothetical protein